MSEHPSTGAHDVPLESVAGNVGLFTDGDWILSEDLKSGEDVRLLQLGDIGPGLFNDKSSKWISQTRFEELNCTPLLPGDILISRMAEPIARACLVPDFGYTAITAVDVAILRVDPDVADARYVMLMLNSTDFAHRADAVASGVTRKRISRKNLGALPFPLPPLAVQREVREQLEARLVRVADGLATLTSAVAHLDLFRAAIRQDACLGRLTGAPPGRGESGEDGLPALPSSWQWESIAQLAADEPRAITDGPFGSNLKTAHYVDEGPRVIRLQNIGNGEFTDIAAHITEEHFRTLQAHEARPGDVVMAAMGEVLPRACLVPDWLGPAIVKADCPRLRPRADLNADYLVVALNSQPVRTQAARIIHGVGRPRLNLKEMKALKVPVPPASEQALIVDTVRRYLAAATELEERFRAAIASAAQLRAALHHVAFVGGLGPDDGANKLHAALVGE